MLNKLFALALLAGTLGACQTTDQPLRIINQTSYPNQADIVLPPGLELEAITFDIPRDLSQQIIKNTPECLAVEAASRTRTFWEQCGQYKALENTNIYVGLDRANFEKLRNNLRKLQVRDQQYQARIEEVNRQRRDWRRKNGENVAPAATPNGMVLTPPGV